MLARNFRSGTKWLPDTITERVGPLTYLVKVKNNLTWKRHVDQLRSRTNQNDESVLAGSESEMTIPLPIEQSDGSSSPEVIPTTNDTSTTIPEDVLASSSATSSTSRYPRRDNRRPPDRLVYNHS